MSEEKRPSVSLLLLPIVALAAILLTEHLAPKPAAQEAPGTVTSIAPPEQNTTTQPMLLNIAERAKQERKVALETDDLHVVFTNLNTAITSLEIKTDRYKIKEGKSQQLVTTDKEAYLPFGFELTPSLVSPDALWTVVEEKDGSLKFQWENENIRIERSWTAGSSPYSLVSNVEITNQSDQIQNLVFALRSAHYVKREDEQEGFIGRPSPALSHGICSAGEEFERLDRSELVESYQELGKAMHFGPAVELVGISNIYFTMLAAPNLVDGERRHACELMATDRGGTVKEPEGSLFEARLIYPNVTIAPGQRANFSSQIYAGPKEQEALEAFSPASGDVVDLGWFSIIGKGLNWLLKKIHSFTANWGLAIIFLTVIVKLFLYPLTEKSFKSMARMRNLKPEMDRINELYADDREKKGAAIMELYRKHQINPLGGCLPNLLQLPIWFALYQSLSTNIELYHAPFTLWWQDLSAPDPYFVLPIILGALMFLQQKLTPVSLDPMQAKMMLYVMPIFMTAVMLFLPAGLCLYIVTNSTLSIAQQKYIHWRFDTEDAASNAGSATKEEQPSDNKPSPNLTKRTGRGRA